MTLKTDQRTVQLNLEKALGALDAAIRFNKDLQVLTGEEARDLDKARKLLETIESRLYSDQRYGKETE